MKLAGSFLTILLIVASTFALHEGAHGLVSRLLGYETYVRINSSGLIEGEYRSRLDEDLTSIAGPLVTIFQGILGLSLALRNRWQKSLALVGSSLMMRGLAALASLRLPNDEARLGLSWGIGYWTLHVIVITVLAAMFYLTLRALKSKPVEVAYVLVAISISMVAVVVVEAYLPELRL